MIMQPPVRPYVGSVRDPHIAQYQLAITATPDAPVWDEIDSGIDNRIDYYFGNLSAYQQGQYALRLAAWDEAENHAEQIVRFTLDTTPPQVNLLTPAADGLLSTANGPHTISGEIIEQYLAEYRIELSAVNQPDQWTPLVTATELSGNTIANEWNPASFADGVYQLRLTAVDRAGQTGLSQIAISIDNTPPTAVIDTPQEGHYISGPTLVTGSVSDAHLSTYQLAIAPGAKTAATQWSPLGQGNQAITSATLLDWQALPPDGLYTLRLLAQDHAANHSSHLIELTIDTTPPAAPVNLSVTRENERDVRPAAGALTVSPIWPVTGFIAMTILISSELIATTDYLDPGVADGPHSYSVTAVDRAALESAPSAPADIIIDTTPPATTLYVPANNSRIGGLVDIKGTAHSQDDFKEYRLYLQAENTTEGSQLLRRSPVPVHNDLLAQWDTLALTQDARYQLRLESEDINGNIGSFEINVAIDNQPPSAPTGVSATVSDNNISLDWNDNPETDLLGYLVFRNGELANASGIVVGELTPYVVTSSAYADNNRPDGTISYEIYAIDQAGNLSPPAEPVSVDLDTAFPSGYSDCARGWREIRTAFIHQSRHCG